jgi:D-lyxose ketol-isomerase
MSDSKRIGRRAVCAGIVGMSGGLLAAGNAMARQRLIKPATVVSKPAIAYKNSDFYDAQGKLNEKAAKDAYLRLMETAGYPISDRVRKDLWVSDFGLGRFAEVGLGGVTWVNEKDGNYASIEIFLLPNQVIPEHWHVPLDKQNVKTKMESWIVRFGSTYAYGEGEPTAKPSVKPPESEAKYLTMKHETPLMLGESTGIKKPLEKHWQQAGPKGAIVTEVSTYHTGEAARFTNPNVKF